MAPRYLLLLVSVAVGGLPMLGAEPKAAKEVSIESAKRDFETLRGSPDPAPDSSLKLPRINASQLTRPAGNAPVPSATRRQTLREKQQKERDENWLLEAMLEKPEDVEDADALKKEQEALTADPFEQMIAEQINPSKAQESEEAEQIEAETIADQAVNPLTAFMGDWVSARDRELLIPESKHANRETWLGGEDRGISVPTITQQTSFQEMASGRAERMPAGLKEVANPYLDHSIPIFDEPIQPPAPNHFHQPNVEVPSQTAGEPVAPTRSVVSPEPPMNRNDESKKYFPQLKRF